MKTARKKYIGSIRSDNSEIEESETVDFIVFLVIIFFQVVNGSNSSQIVKKRGKIEEENGKRVWLGLEPGGIFE